MPHLAVSSGYQLHYELYGDGASQDKIFLIMGFGCCKSYWQPQVKHILHLGEYTETDSTTGTIVHRNKYEICLFDSRGFGETGDTLFSRHTSTNTSNDCMDLLTHLKWINHPQQAAASQSHHLLPRLHIVGWSMGGMVAQELVLELLKYTPVDNVHDVKTCIFVSSSSGGFRLKGEQGRGAGWLPRNVPPSSGIKIGLRMLLDCFTTSSRIKYILRLHFAPKFLAAPFDPNSIDFFHQTHPQFSSSTSSSSPLLSSVPATMTSSDSSSGCDEQQQEEIALLHAAAEEAAAHHIAGTSASVTGSASASVAKDMHQVATSLPNSQVTNETVFTHFYTGRAPFDRSLFLYAYSLFGHLCTVLTHHVSFKRLQQIRHSSIRPLVVTGQKDRLVHPANSMRLAAALSCPMLSFHDAGHMIHVENAPEFSQELHKHIQASVISSASPSTRQTIENSLYASTYTARYSYVDLQWVGSPDDDTYTTANDDDGLPGPSTPSSGHTIDTNIVDNAADTMKVHKIHTNYVTVYPQQHDSTTLPTNAPRTHIRNDKAAAAASSFPSVSWLVQMLLMYPLYLWYAVCTFPFSVAYRLLSHVLGYVPSSRSVSKLPRTASYTYIQTPITPASSSRHLRTLAKSFTYTDTTTTVSASALSSLNKRTTMSAPHLPPQHFTDSLLLPVERSWPQMMWSAVGLPLPSLWKRRSSSSATSTTSSPVSSTSYRSLHAALN